MGTMKMNTRTLSRLELCYLDVSIIYLTEAIGVGDSIASLHNVNSPINVV